MREHDELMQAMIERLPWTRRLAAALVADAGLAEDVVQDAWIEFLRRPPRARASLGSWLASVLRNLVLQQRRRRRRGEELERDQIEPDQGYEETAEVVARAEAHRTLVEAVFGLARAERDVVLLRFFEGLSSEEIGVRLGVPPATVRTRLRRALVKLRTALEPRLDTGSTDWLAALVPLLRAPAAAPSLGASAPVPIAKTCALLSALAVVGVLAFRARDEGVETTPYVVGEVRAQLPLAGEATPDPTTAPRFAFHFAFAFDFDDPHPAGCGGREGGPELGAPLARSRVSRARPVVAAGRVAHATEG